MVASRYSRTIHQIIFCFTERLDKEDAHTRLGDWRSINYHERNIHPTGASLDAAPPEQLRCYQLSLEQAEAGHRESMINGPAADTWGAGVVCFEMLTGNLPFCPDINDVLPEAPDHVPEGDKEYWQLSEAVLRLHHDWVRHVCLLYLVCLSDLMAACVLSDSLCFSPLSRPDLHAQSTWSCLS